MSFQMGSRITATILIKRISPQIITQTATSHQVAVFFLQMNLISLFDHYCSGIMRLPRKFSMTRHAEFSLVRQSGQAKGGSYLVLSTFANDQLPHHKAGVIVTRKVGNAVTRNRLRRRIHAICAKHLSSITKTRYLVTILRWRAPEATFSDLETDWLKQARRLGILSDNK